MTCCLHLHPHRRSHELSLYKYTQLALFKSKMDGGISPARTLYCTLCSQNTLISTSADWLQATNQRRFSSRSLWQKPIKILTPVEQGRLNTVQSLPAKLDRLGCVCTQLITVCMTSPINRCNTTQVCPFINKNCPMLRRCLKWVKCLCGVQNKLLLCSVKILNSGGPPAGPITTAPSFLILWCHLYIMVSVLYRVRMPTGSLCAFYQVNDWQWLWGRSRGGSSIRSLWGRRGTGQHLHISWIFFMKGQAWAVTKHDGTCSFHWGSY